MAYVISRKRFLCTVEHVDRLHQPPEFSIGDAFVARHEKDAAKPDMEFLQGHLLDKILVHCGDHNIMNVVLQETHSEEVELIVRGNLIPLVILE